ncbi:MAG: SurA N-terminal domain-containing protein, partial [Cyanobacteria bacterium REEB65]|nr:SurA N-terminal domain-containing protein [Cyanobacteria bacterium REEB65]
MIVAVGVALVAGEIAYWSTKADAYIGTVDGQRIDRASYESQLAARRAQITGQLGGDPDSPQARQMMASAQQEIVDQLVDRQVLLEAAATRKISVDSGQVETNFRGLRAQFPDERSFDNALEQHGLTAASLRQALTDQATIQKLR